MTISDIARERWAFVQEASFGEQVTGSNLQIARITSEGLKQATDIANSREIRDDRQVAGVIRTKIAVAGNMDFELSFASFDDFLAAALMSANVKAQGTLTMDTLPTDGDTITIGATTYRFKSTMTQANDIQIETADLPGTQANLVATINGTGVAGTDYYAGTTSPNASAEMSDFDGDDDSILTALAYGLSGNAIATTETFTAETNIFDDDTLGTTTAGAGWTAPVTVTATTISAASADSSFNDSGSGFAGIVANQWIKTSGFTNAENNGYFKVASATTGKIVVYATLVVEASGESRTIKQGSSITNGVTKNSFNLERTYTDLSNELALYVGCMINQLNLTVGTNALITGSMAVMGKIESSETASGGAGYDDANNNEILNSIDHVLGIYENLVTVDVLDFNMTILNNLRERLKVGTLGAFDLGTGQIQLSGTFTAYYESKTLYDKYLDFDSTSLAKVFEDTAGNAYVIDIPSVKITDAARHAGAGMGDDFKVPCNWQAFRDADEDITIRIVRFAA